MQQYAIALQIPRRPPRKARTVKRKTAGSIGLSLTLPKFYLATYNTQEIAHSSSLYYLKYPNTASSMFITYM